MQVTDGSVAAFFALQSFNRRSGVAIYSLRVVNRATSALRCRSLVLSRNGEPVAAYPQLVEVAPLSSSATQIALRTRDFASFDRVVAEVVGNGVHCLVEAAPPPRRKAYGRLGIFATVSVACGIALLAATTLLCSMIPRIEAFAVAPQALSGTTVEAQYNASGAGRLAFLVTAADGRRVAGGPLSDRRGSFFFAIPTSTKPGSYAARLTIDGPLGGSSETLVVNAIGRIKSANVRAISVHPVVAKPGQTILISYSAAGDEGYVRLIGTDGTIWAQRPFSKAGETRLVVPMVSDRREMHVLLHVTKGSSVAQSMAGILVENSRPSRGHVREPSAGAADANGVFDVRTPIVMSGGSILLRVLSPRNGMRISLTDAHSHEIGATDVGAGAHIVTLRAPREPKATRLTVVARFIDALGEENVVRPLTILP